jgi:hypothetical protein
MFGWSIADANRDYHLDVDLDPVSDDRSKVQIAYHRNPSPPPDWIIERSAALGGIESFSSKISEILEKTAATANAQIAVDFRFRRESWRPVFHMPTGGDIVLGAADNLIVSTVTLKLLSENEPVTVRLGIHDDDGAPSAHITVQWSRKELVVGDYSLEAGISALYDRAWGIGQRFVREKVAR